MRIYRTDPAVDSRRIWAVKEWPIVDIFSKTTTSYSQFTRPCTLHRLLVKNPDDLKIPQSRWSLEVPGKTAEVAAHAACVRYVEPRQCCPQGRVQSSTLQFGREVPHSLLKIAICLPLMNLRLLNDVNFLPEDL